MTNGWENVKGEQVRTWSIRRTVEFEFGERLWDSMLNQFGRLILRCQPENVHALIPLWFEPVKESKKGKHEACYPPYIWACDAELHAKYLLKRVYLNFKKSSTYILMYSALYNSAYYTILMHMCRSNDARMNWLLTTDAIC